MKGAEATKNQSEITAEQIQVHVLGKFLIAIFKLNLHDFQKFDAKNMCQGLGI